jgi:hypothetical protein
VYLKKRKGRKEVIETYQPKNRPSLPPAMWESLQQTYVLDNWFKPRFKTLLTSSDELFQREHVYQPSYREMGSRINMQSSYETKLNDTLRSNWSEFMNTLEGGYGRVQFSSKTSHSGYELVAPAGRIWFCYTPIEALAFTKNYKHPSNTRWFSLGRTLLGSWHPYETHSYTPILRFNNARSSAAFSSLEVPPLEGFPEHHGFYKEFARFNSPQRIVGLSLSLTPSFKNVFLSMSLPGNGLYTWQNTSTTYARARVPHQADETFPTTPFVLNHPCHGVDYTAADSMYLFMLRREYWQKIIQRTIPKYRHRY